MDTPNKRANSGLRFFILVAVVFFLFVFGHTLVSVYADWLWFVHDARQPEVFAKTFRSQAFLWVDGFVVSVAFIYLNARASLSSQSVYESAPTDENSRAAANVLGV
jgi:hypothetical protein